MLFRQLNVVHLTSTDLSSPTSAATGLLADIAAFTGKVPKGIQLGGGDSNRDLRSSGAQRITAGDWQITSRMIGMRAESTLTLRPDGNVLGRSSWFISSAELAGRWQFDPAEQVLHLELSGGTMEGLHAKPVRIIRWDSADSAECTMEGRRARIQRVFPART